MDAYRWLVLAHIVAGGVALTCFWFAAGARKGSPWHKRAGRVYLLAMIAVLASALPMSVTFLAQGRLAFGVFLAYLVVITATACWLSWRAIRLKRDRAAYFDVRYRRVAWLNLVAGIVVLGIGVANNIPLLYLFCWVGVITGRSMLRDQRTPPAAPNWWLREHYTAMIANGVATHVAFLGIGMRSTIQAIGWPGLDLVPWLGPLAVAVIAGVVLDRRYGFKSDERKKVEASVSRAGA